MIPQETRHCRAQEFHHVVTELNAKGYEVVSIATVSGQLTDWIYLVATHRGDEQ